MNTSKVPTISATLQSNGRISIGKVNNTPEKASPTNNTENLDRFLLGCPEVLVANARLPTIDKTQVIANTEISKPR